MRVLVVRQLSHRFEALSRCRAPERAFAAKPELSLRDALAGVKAAAKAKFDETVEISVNLGVDPRKPGQNIRSTTVLPNGTGKAIRVAVFAADADAATAEAAGADLVGADDLIDQVSKGVIEFDRCVATPAMMPKLGKIARILGPRGLMPNPKLGTVTTDVAKGVKMLKGGQVQFRTEKTGIVHAGIGKASFKEEALAENVRSFMVALANLKPEGQKGTYIKGVSLSSTMGPGFTVDVANVDPASARFML